MIITRIQGGLGNQLFQYSAARYFSIKKRDSELRFLTSYYALVRSRRYMLDRFETMGSTTTLLDNSLLFLISLPLPGPYQFKTIRENILLHQGMWTRQSKIRNSDRMFINKAAGKVYLDGFWQDKKYAEAIRESLLCELKLKSKVSAIAQRYSSEISRDNSVFIHVRRGDYLKNSNSFPVCSIDYYKNAIQFIETQVKMPRFFLFSDDLDWVNKHFVNLKNKTIIEGCKDEAEELSLMSLCRHSIIANSTFSWWGAWLCQQVNHIVVTPKHWFGNSPNATQSLMLPSWYIF